MRHARYGVAAIAMLIAIFVLAGCGGTTAPTASSGNAGSAGGGTLRVTCAAAGAAICTKTITVGGSSKTVLATSDGKTLYYFQADTASQIACSGSCASLWPPLMSSSSSASGNFGLSGTVTVDNGANGTQFAYNGHPLYTYSKDQSITDATGEGFAGKWFVVTPDIQPLASGSGTGGGYGGYGNYP